MVSPKLLALHSWHQMAGLRVKRKSPQKSQPAQHRVHLASGAAVLSWPHHKDGRHMHAQSSLLQQTPRRKAWLWCSKKALQRQMKRQLAQAEISHQSWQQQASDQDNWCSSMRKASHKFEAERKDAETGRYRRLKEKAASQSSATRTLTCPKCSRVCVSRIGLYSHQWAYKNWHLTLQKILVCKESAVVIIIIKHAFIFLEYWTCANNITADIGSVRFVVKIKQKDMTGIPLWVVLRSHLSKRDISLKWSQICDGMWVDIYSFLFPVLAFHAQEHLIWRSGYSEVSVIHNSECVL